MPTLVIALIALAIFLAVGALLVLAMFFENRRKALVSFNSGPQKSGAPRRKRAA